MDRSIVPCQSSSAGEVRLTRYEREVAVLAVERVSQDVPLCPTSALDASPILPEETGDELSGAQRVAIAAMVAGRSFTMAARAAGVDRRTLYRWRTEPAFCRAVDALTRDALVTVATRVRNLMLRATRVLAESMVGPDAAGSAMRVANSSRLWAALNAAETKLEKSEA